MSSSDGPPVALSPEEFRSFPLVEVEEKTHNTRRFRFALPSPDHVLGLTTASCLVVSADVQGEQVMRPYTPVSTEETRGHVDLVIKRYPEGKMSRHIFSLAPGDTLDFKGPFGKLPVTRNMKRRLIMLAGGTGITPMYQVLHAVLGDPEDTTAIDLFFSNSSPEDIILFDELNALQQQHKERFKVEFFVSQPGDSSPPSFATPGRINGDVLKQRLPNAEDPDVMILVCGPPPFMASLSGDKNPDKSQGEVTGVLGDLGWTSSSVYKF